MTRKKNKRKPELAAVGVEWRGAAWAAAAAAVAWWVIVGWFYYHKPDWAEILGKWRLWPNLIPPLWRLEGHAFLCAVKLAACLLWLTGLAYGLGRVLLRRFCVEPEEPAGLTVLSLAAGWGSAGMVMLGLGLLRLWRPWLLWTLLVAGTAALGYAWCRDRSAPVSGAPASGGWEPWEIFLAALLGVFAAFNFFAALMPEIFYDALAYHLALPDIFWKRGGIVPLYENLFSGFPLLVQMLYGIALPVAGDGLTRLLSWSLGAGAALATFAISRRLAGRSTALLAALLFYSIPLLGAMSWKAGVETGWAFFQLAGLYALSVRLTRPESSPRWSVLAGALLGLAMGAKYQAWPSLAVWTAALAVKLPAEGERKNRELVIFAGAALLVVLPWIAKNVVLYINPLYPFFQDLLSGGAAPNWRQLIADSSGRSFAATVTTWAGLKSYLLHPWVLSFRATDNGLVLLLGLPLLFLCRFRSRGYAFLWWIFLGSWGIWSLKSIVFRYLIPHLPIACILLAGAIDEGFKRRLKTGVRAGLVFVFVSMFIFELYWFKALGAHGVVLGYHSPAEYLSLPHRSYHHPYYPAVEFINKNLPADARILFLGEGRGFYCRRDYISTTIYDVYPLQTWLRRSAGARQLREAFRAEGITHILVNRKELGRWQGENRGVLDPGERGLRVWQDFMKGFLRQVFEHQGPVRRGTPASSTVVYEVI